MEILCNNFAKLLLGFNGASTTWSRMDARERVKTLTEKVLQRGLDHVVEDGSSASRAHPRSGRRLQRGLDHVVEDGSCSSEIPLDFRASTGPRPRGRGWEVSAIHGGVVMKLQRGLDHVVEDGL